MRAAVALLCVALTGCGVSSERSARPLSDARLPAEQALPAPNAGSDAGARLFLVRGDHLVEVTRPEPAGGVAQLLQLLVDGPSDAEVARGLRSAIPSGSVLRGVRLADRTAHLELAGAFTSVDGEEQILAFAQFVFTATSTREADRVAVSIAGERVSVPRADGSLAAGPVAPTDYASLLLPP